MNGPVNYAFVAARGGSDFDDDDLTVARYVQQAVISLDQQCVALSRVTAAEGSVVTGADLGLSGREVAVLQLVADGNTTRAVSRRLGCTPRTVEKHLENCYRKLEVRDRLNAVRVARLAGVLGPAEPASATIGSARSGRVPRADPGVVRHRVSDTLRRTTYRRKPIETIY